MNQSITRRQFFKHTTMAGASLAAWRAVPSLRAAESPANKIRVGIMGCNGRGMAHIAAHLGQPNVEIAYVCDVDSRAIEKGVAAVEKKQQTKPQGVKDFRKILDDKSVDVLSIATPNHWHAIATIFACAAGKHVYVEKPGSHSPHESELMVAAARKNKRVVQMGNQRRSWPAIIEGIEKLRGGVIGKVFSARSWYSASRPTIGRGKPAPVPEWLDYTLWQGAAPERPYKDNLIHYNWHWHWHWGNGELGNNGIHSLDVARWGLGVTCPRRVTCGGGRYHFDDDQETPDTSVTTFDFGDKFITWDCSSCNPRGSEKQPTASFYGEGGTLAIVASGYQIFDPKGKLLAENKGPGGDPDHFANFHAAVRGEAKPHSEISIGQTSTMLCHYGNIAYRAGRTINIDPKTHKILDDKAATALWQREYRKGWEPKV